MLLRGDFQNAKRRFERDRKGHVAFIGGSITEMNGYRPMVIERLKERFPKTEFTFTDAGISSTCSTTGAFRLRDHVLSKGPVDLFFVEFAVNDDQDAGHAHREAVRGMEGIIRNTRRHNPASDIVVTYFVNPSMLETTQQGKMPVSIAAHEEVAKHYRIPAIMLHQQVADSIAAGELTWETYGGTHPAPAGNRIAATMIERLMQRTWDASENENSAEIKPHVLPEPIDPLSYVNGRFLSVDAAQSLTSAVVKVPDWSSIPGGKRARFSEENLLCLEGSGAEFSITFEGTAIGVYVLAGPDAARLDVSVDGGNERTIDLHHHYSAGLHYPRTVMLATDLTDAKHTLTVRIAEKQIDPKRSAARILAFAVN
ncbi:MAG: GDSL-type esterase/lipase family protein [Pirellulaceae bacterium]